MHVDENYADVLASLPPPRHDLIEAILVQRVKQVFSPAPHPSIDGSTGRRSHRPISSTVTVPEEQPWRSQPAVATLLLWCVQNIQVCKFDMLAVHVLNF